ncbi:MAG: prephenate dehydrogenase [Bacillota bacterium]
MLTIKKVTIIGMGLIGGSWGLALKRVRPDIEICGVDVNQCSLVKSREAGIVDWYSIDTAEGVKDADLVVLACPLNKIIAQAEEAILHMKEGSILTDVGSVKETLVSAIENVIPTGIAYVPGHPMAGSEKKGIEGAHAYLFENAAYIFTPTANTPPQAKDLVMDLVKTMGARPLVMTPKEHDLQVASVSHLPHLVAAALVNSVGALKTKFPGLLLLAAGGFRDTTRIASSQPEMWKDICMNNRDAILDVLQSFEGQIQCLREALENGDAGQLLNTFVTARTLRDEVPAGIKGILPELFEIVVTVPDQPGMIGRIANLLGNNNINIIDIEILRVREGDGGTIRFGFLEREGAVKAVQLLRENSFVVNMRF